MWFDTHAHLTSDRFDEDREELIEKLPSLGVSLLVDVGYDPDWRYNALSSAQKASYIYAALGVHPHEADIYTDEVEQELSAQITGYEKVVAVGEIGLDYHYEYSPRAVQRDVFARQLALARRLKKPVVIHMREATQDTLEILRAYRTDHGVMHCYSGSLETAKLALDMGFYISFSGSVTFKNAVKLREVARYVPMDRLLVETDCPFLAPEPKRGRRNQPDYVRYTGAFLAQLRGVATEEMAQITMRNGCQLFCIRMPDTSTEGV
ncbi:MAG: TatD family hydrolase [Christensenellales bacterium]|jgi:TatD DNase family protein